MAKAPKKSKERPKNVVSDKVAKQQRNALRLKAEKAVAKTKKSKINERKGKSKRTRTEENPVKTVVTTIMVGKKRSFLRNFCFNLVFILAITASKGEEENVKYIEKGKKFTKKQKEDLLVIVSEQLKTNLLVLSSNLYVVNIGFCQLSRPNFLIYTENVINKITGNSNYMTPVPTLASITSLIALESTTRSDKDFINADIYLENIKDLMRQLCIYIANTCLNDLFILRGAGVRENYGKGNTVQPGEPNIIGCKDTKYKTEAKVKLEKKIEGAQSYRGQYRIWNGTVWGDWIPCGNSRGIYLTFKGLPRNSTMQFQVCCVGTITDSDWSNTKDWNTR